MQKRSIQHFTCYYDIPHNKVKAFSRLPNLSNSCIICNTKFNQNPNVSDSYAIKLNHINEQDNPSGKIIFLHSCLPCKQNLHLYCNNYCQKPIQISFNSSYQHSTNHCATCLLNNNKQIYRIIKLASLQ